MDAQNPPGHQLSWSLSWLLKGAAGLTWAFVLFDRTPPRLRWRWSMLGLAVACGILLHGHFYPPTAQVTCPDNARYYARLLGVDFPGLIEFLELLALQRPEVGPVVILREFQHLRDIGGEVLLSEIFRKLESKKQGRSLISIFIESSTHTWVDPDHFLRSRESFHPYLVSHMDQETTRKELVDVLQVFSPADFEVVWDAVKGHAGSLDTIFHYVRAGMPLDEAVETARSVTYRRLLAGLAKAPPRPQLRRCREELERLRQQNWTLVVARPLANPQLRFLIENNILFVSEPWVVIPQHELMRWAIDLLLSLPPDDETQEGTISPADSSIHL